MAMHVPKGQDLLVRGPFLQDFKSPKAKSPPYTVPESEFTDMKGLLDKSQPMKIAFYTRHNPHPVRVRHMKGLLDVPICCVEDNMDQRILWSPPSGQDLSSVYFPRGNSRYGANSSKQFPAIGIVPVTSAWRDELERMANVALSKAMGIPPPSRGGRNSRPGTSQLGDKPTHLKNLNEQQIVDLLCRILQTDSVPLCQAWLNSANESEKNIVLNLLNMAATGEVEYATRPGTSNRRYSYWSHRDSLDGPRSRDSWRPRSHSYDATMTDPAADFNFLPLPSWKHTEDKGLEREHVPGPGFFPLPENDTVVQAARQLSGLASRKNLRASLSCDHNLSGLARRQTPRPQAGTLSATGRPRSASVHTISPFQHDALKNFSRSGSRQDTSRPYLPKLSSREKTNYHF